LRTLRESGETSLQKWPARAGKDERGLTGEGVPRWDFRIGKQVCTIDDTHDRGQKKVGGWRCESQRKKWTVIKALPIKKNIGVKKEVGVGETSHHKEREGRAVLLDLGSIQHSPTKVTLLQPTDDTQYRGRKKPKKQERKG